MSILDEILEHKRGEVERLRARAGTAHLEEAARDAPAALDLAGALRRGDRLAVIAEIKRRSPSKGLLAPGLDAATVASAYATGGAAALSVLTDQHYFGGSLDDLAAARSATVLPVLRKDFTVDPIQVLEARASCADAILLITRALPDDGLLTELRVMAEDLGMAALVEVDDEAGVDRALAAGATLVGITNRDLRTFGEDLTTAERLAERLPRNVTAVAESAIRGPYDARRMAEAGFHAVLVGEMLVRAPDPTGAVRSLAVARALA